MGKRVLHDDRLRTAVGADYYTSSLYEAVEACLEVSQEAGADEPRVTAAGRIEPGGPGAWATHARQKWMPARIQSEPASVAGINARDAEVAG